jgi:hypothetical protein
MREIILLITGIAATYLLIGYVARSITTMRLQMTERPVTRNPRLRELNRRVHGDHIKRNPRT